MDRFQEEFGGEIMGRKDSENGVVFIGKVYMVISHIAMLARRNDPDMTVKQWLMMGREVN